MPATGRGSYHEEEEGILLLQILKHVVLVARNGTQHLAVRAVVNDAVHVDVEVVEHKAIPPRLR